ncbi:MAG: antibiotic biosynthesis monooxygenase [Deltaproteobacteria bacterium]|nr:MAG: antibiotic biosynthesis monooxygenase [Deltaproteobacteria bacterium]
MISVIASIKVKPSCKDLFLTAFKANVPSVMAEEGCLEYAPMVDLDTEWPVQALDINVVTIIEKWESLDALKEHLSSPHMVSFREKTEELVIETSVKILTAA